MDSTATETTLTSACLKDATEPFLDLDSPVAGTFLTT